MSTLLVEIDEQTRTGLTHIAALSHENIDSIVNSALTRFVKVEIERIEDEQRYQDCIQNGGVENSQVIEWLERCNAGERLPCPK